VRERGRKIGENLVRAGRRCTSLNIVSRNPIRPGRRASDIEGEQKTGFAPLSNIINRG